MAAIDVADLVVGAVPARVLGVFTAATGFAANVVLAGKAAGMEVPQCQKLSFNFGDLPLDLLQAECGCHIRYLI